MLLPAGAANLETPAFPCCALNVEREPLRKKIWKPAFDTRFCSCNGRLLLAGVRQETIMSWIGKMKAHAEMAARNVRSGDSS